MIGEQLIINNERVFIDYHNNRFKCPYCRKKYKDSNDKYSNRIATNKSFITSIKCSCSKKFFITVNYKGDFVSFK